MEKRMIETPTYTQLAATQDGHTSQTIWIESAFFRAGVAADAHGHSVFGVTHGNSLRK